MKDLEQIRAALGKLMVEMEEYFPECLRDYHKTKTFDKSNACERVMEGLTKAISGVGTLISINDKHQL